MNWEAVGAVAELIAALGVIVTLIYLGRQIRHNSSLLDQSISESRLRAISTATTAMREVRNNFILNEEFAELIVRARQEHDSLSDVDLLRYFGFIQSFLEALADIYAQTKGSGLAAEVWETQGRQRILLQLSSEASRQHWDTIKHGFPRDFANEVDSVLVSSDT